MRLLVALLAIFCFAANANNCANDTKKFCSGIGPGKGQIARCLSDYEKQLSSSCARELKEFKVKSGKKNPCFEDLAEYCSEIPAGARKLEYCLLKNETRLSATCSADFKKKKGNILVRDVCAQDIANTCYSEVSGPEGAITKCLIKNKSKVSKFCQNTIDKKIADLKARNPCFDDTDKFCPTQIKVADIQECLEKKSSNLTPNCKTIVEKEKSKAAANPCYRDLVRHCKPNLRPQQQVECLDINANELSMACKAFRSKEQDKIKKMVDLCEQDRLKVCPKAPFQDGMVVKCLRENKTKISSQCAALI